MALPYVGEIRMFAGNFAPAGWAFCEGQLLPITEYETLFQLIGTTYGGDGQNTFALPDLRGRLPLHQGTFQNTYLLAESGGQETVVLTVNQIPAHNHAAQASSDGGTQTGPGGGLWAASGLNQFAAGSGTNNMANSMGNTGGNQPHENMMPFLVVSFIISLFGIFPSQT